MKSRKERDQPVAIIQTDILKTHISIHLIFNLLNLYLSFKTEITSANDKTAVSLVF